MYGKFLVCSVDRNASYLFQSPLSSVYLNTRLIIELNEFPELGQRDQENGGVCQNSVFGSRVGLRHTSITIYTSLECVRQQRPNVQLFSGDASLVSAATRRMMRKSSGVNFLAIRDEEFGDEKMLGLIIAHVLVDFN